MKRNFAEIILVFFLNNKFTTFQKLMNKILKLILKAVKFGDAFTKTLKSLKIVNFKNAKLAIDSKR